MSMIEQRVATTRRRLMLNSLLERLAIAIVLSAALWALVLLAERLLALGVPFWPSVWSALGLMGAITLAGTYLSRVSTDRAAVVLDGAAGLKERLSTALACRGDAGGFARAAVADAEKTAGLVHVPLHVPYRAPRLWPWSLATVAAAALLAGLMPPMNLLAGQKKEQPPDQRAVQSERKNITTAVNQQLNKMKEFAKDRPELEGLAQDLKPLELPDKPTQTPDDVRREALKQIDKVAEQVEKKKDLEKSETLDQMKKMLAQLDAKKGADPSSKLEKSLAKGDMQGARQAVEELKKQLEEAANKGDESAKQQLAEVQKQLENVSKQLAELGENKQLQKELEHKAGLSAQEAKKLMDQLAKTDPKALEKALQQQLGEKGLSQEQLKELAKKIAQNQQAMKECQKLAQCMSKAAQQAAACKNPGQGDNAGAAEGASAAMSEAMGQLSEMEMTEQMAQELNAALGELKQLREGVCKGGFGPGDKPGSNVGPQGGNYGLGYGSRIGREKTAHNLTPSKVNSPMHNGEIIGQMLFDGPQVRGEAQAAVRDAVNAAVRDATDAIQRDEVPRQYSRAVREYFESLAGLAGGQPAGAADAQKPANSPADDE